MGIGMHPPVAVVLKASLQSNQITLRYTCSVTCEGSGEGGGVGGGGVSDGIEGDGMEGGGVKLTGHIPSWVFSVIIYWHGWCQ